MAILYHPAVVDTNWTLVTYGCITC